MGSEQGHLKHPEALTSRFERKASGLEGAVEWKRLKLGEVTDIVMAAPFATIADRRSKMRKKNDQKRNT